VVAHISRMGIEAFNPKIRIQRKVWGTLKEVSAPLFRGYVFAKVSSVYLGSVKYVRGARRIVEFGGIPTPIDEPIINAIRYCATSEKENSTGLFSPGDSVMINRGALYGLEGVLIEELSNRERVVLLLKTIDWQARIHVGKTAIQKSPVSFN
jgi:transcription antitermination factor NusG